MKFSDEKLREVARITLGAEEGAYEIPQLIDRYPDLTVEEAYRVQEVYVAEKLKKGHRILGPKMGLTSRAKQEMMGVKEPVYGYCFDYMLLNDEEPLQLSELVHPKVEAEIAFVLKEDLEGPGVTGAQVLAATDYMVAAIEIIDSRYKDFKFTLADVVADNTSSARLKLGSIRLSPSELDPRLTGVVLMKNGEVVELGAGAAVLGHPAHAVAMLANMLARKGDKLRAGQCILSGGITGAVVLAAGDVVTASFDRLGTIHLRVEA